jgi:hypothetical protein
MPAANLNLQLGVWGLGRQCVAQLYDLEIRPGQRLAMKESVSNTRLFLGNIPRSLPVEKLERAIQEVRVCLC